MADRESVRVEKGSIVNREPAKITGVVLAGGQGRRMGGSDKGLLRFHGRPLVAYALDALVPFCDEVLISANRNRESYEGFGYPVVADANAAYEGPLAGLLSAMRQARNDYVLTLPCDSPLVASELLTRLHEALRSRYAEIATASDGNRTQAVFLLAERRLLSSLEEYLAGGGRKVETWLKRHKLAVVDCGDHPEWFENVNTSDELADLERSGGVPRA
jgi:molybdenum cofactor guanylyltransferase